VLAELGQHVVEEADTGTDLDPPGAVEVDLDQHRRLLGGALDAPDPGPAHSTSSSAALKAAISSGVPIDTRSHPGGPTSRISTPRSSRPPDAARRTGKCPKRTKFASESATFSPLLRSQSTVASRSARSLSTVPSSSARCASAVRATAWVSVDRWYGR